MIRSQIKYFFMSLNERLWVQPAIHAGVALAIVGIAMTADALGRFGFLPDISAETLKDLLRVIATTLLGVATFAVASMVSAFGFASQTASPRAFKLVIADGNSQHALSTFVGAYIFSIIGLISMHSGVLGLNGRFILFAGTVWMFGWVILTFVRWVDNIARLGLMSDTIDRCQAATIAALREWGPDRRLGCAAGVPPAVALAVFADDSAHVEMVDLESLEGWAEKHGAEIYIISPPGAFATPERPLAQVAFAVPPGEMPDFAPVRRAFVTGLQRSFEADPRFGLITMSEIASRALSPAVNDPGTAIDIVRRMIVIFETWDAILQEGEGAPRHRHIFLDPLEAAPLFEDAFRGAERDGAGFVEVGVWLQNCFHCLASASDPGIRQEAVTHSRMALARAEAALGYDGDLETLRAAARWSDAPDEAAAPG